MYGINDKHEAVVIARNVVRVFGGGHKAVLLLLETACAETDLGTFPDRHPEKLGVGLTQFDQIALDDLQQRTRGRHRRQLKQHFGYDLNSLALADLADDAILAFCLTRLKYKLIPEPIPQLMVGRARYWKQHWNTQAGRGTTEQYINDVLDHLPKNI